MRREMLRERVPLWWVEIFWVFPPLPFSVCVCVHVSSCLWSSAGRCVYAVRKGHSICPLIIAVCVWCDCCSNSIINVLRSRRVSPFLFAPSSVIRNGGSLCSWHTQGARSKSVYSVVHSIYRRTMFNLGWRVTVDAATTVCGCTGTLRFCWVRPVFPVESRLMWDIISSLRCLHYVSVRWTEKKSRGCIFPHMCVYPLVHPVNGHLINGCHSDGLYSVLNCSCSHTHAFTLLCVMSCNDMWPVYWCLYCEVWCVCLWCCVIKVLLCPYIVIVANLCGCQVLYNHRYVENYSVESFEPHFLSLPQNFGNFISFCH